jgi:hypothetical protein
MNHKGGWIGVDLDGCLAHYESWISVDHIGKPIPLMVARVKQWISEGQQVKIFTARVAREGDEATKARQVIEEWCLKHIGTILEITNKKDFAMITLWDDRCVQIEPNTGRRMDGAFDPLEQLISNPHGFIKEPVDASSLFI